MKKKTKKEQIQALIDAGYSYEQVVSENIAKESYVKSLFTQNGKAYEQKTEEEPEEEEPADKVEDASAEVVDTVPDISEEEPVEQVMTVGEEVIEGVTEEDIVEVAVEDIPEDAEIKEEPLAITLPGAVHEVKIEGVFTIDEPEEEDEPEEADEPEAYEPEAEEPEAEEDPLAPLYKNCFDCLERIELNIMPHMTRARCTAYVNLAKQVLVTKDLKGERLQALNARYNYIIPRPAGRSASVKVLALHREMTKLFRTYYKKQGGRLCPLDNFQKPQLS